MSPYPVFLTNLDEQGAVVVGTGPAAERKVEGLLDAGAEVTLIAPSPSGRFRTWCDQQRIHCVERAYRPGDLKGAVLAIVTEATAETKRRIWDEAVRRNVLINTTGSSAHSTFSNGACLRRGPLVISISTSGAAPTLSVRIRDQLAEEFGPEYDAFLTLMNVLREPMQQHVSDFQERRDQWYTLVDSDILNLLRQNRHEAALARVESIVGSPVMDEIEDWSW